MIVEILLLTVSDDIIPEYAMDACISVMIDRLAGTVIGVAPDMD